MMRNILSIKKETFRFDGGLTTGPSSRDGLSVDGVGTITGYEYPWDFCPGCAVNLLEVTCLVCIKPFLEDVRIWLMTDSEEETVDGYIDQLFIRFALTLDEVGAFNTVLTI
jgi:hypothetical protein